eukprot:CAMPEP_0117657340 /NCGR_PEP_ID=MMETSP0804-20121206/5278_1 /TAXON_ID=1074897 /ORGANISM="Tetraselmis astigmatica, Strain CCMP880" /LENGTH=1545 /DNA_ID=CAMNT_0005463787 /DNA_START=295 /DNA_END=4932 /DNA_ORIENTATION=-
MGMEAVDQRKQQEHTEDQRKQEEEDPMEDQEEEEQQLQSSGVGENGEGGDDNMQHVSVVEVTEIQGESEEEPHSEPWVLSRRSSVGSLADTLANLVASDVGSAALPELLQAALSERQQDELNQLMEAAQSFTAKEKKRKEGISLGLQRSSKSFLHSITNLQKLLVPVRERARLGKDNIPLSKTQKLDLVGRLLQYRSSSGKTFQEKLASELEEVGVRMPTITVQYNNLSIEAKAKDAGRIQTVATTIKAGVEVGKKQPKKMLLNNATGVLKPGRSTLLIGPPGGGKSVFMKALSGRLTGDKKDLKITGSLLYNGHRQDEFYIENSSAYVEQIDNHFPTLTVRETLEFAKQCQRGTGEGSIVATVKKLLAHRKELKAQSSFVPKEQDEVFEDLLKELNSSGAVVVDYVLKLMGIDGCQDTVVGDAMLRGISGGQKKRVTTAEMLVGFRQLLLMDEISTGLDSATTFQVALFITNYTHAMSCTSVVGLLQPPPETVALFDDIMMIADGQILYHGPTSSTLPFFQTLGFNCPPRKDMGSFLQEILTPQGQLEYGPQQPQGGSPTKLDRLAVPVEDIKMAFYKSEAGQQLVAASEQPFDRSLSHPDALRKEKYALSSFEAFQALLSRQVLLLKRNTNLVYTRALFAIITGLILGTVFFQLKPDLNDARSYFGLFYLICMYLALGNLPQVSIAFNAKSILYKQKNNNFFPAWIYVVVQLAVHAPFAFMESLVFAICLYFLSGLATDGAQYFFIWWVIAFSTHCSMATMFRFISNISPSLVRASSIASVVLLVNILTSGYTIVFGDIPAWWIWVYWISPFAYAIRAFVINEMTSPKWGNLGMLALESFDFATERYWIWAGIGFQWAFTAVVMTCSALVLTFLDTRPAHQVNISDKSRMEAMVAAKNELRRAKLKLKELNRPAASAHEVHLGVDEDGDQLSFLPITLIWQDLRYIVKTPSGDKLELLRGISGYAGPRRLTALMGGSGAGKTTLMDVISGRKTQGEIKGELLVNGRPKVQSTFARKMGYVEQTDIHSPQTTVREALQFSAALRLPAEATPMQRNQVVQDTIAMVELELLQESLVGMPGLSGLSGEQRKRLTIAVELVSNPSVVFLDEPTSGLDSTAAATVVRAMQSISDAGRTVMATIHQPSIEIFSAFDALVLLKRGGRLIFFGELGEACSKLIGYLESQPLVDPILDGYNPATWMLDASAGEVEVQGKVLDFADLYELSPLKLQNDEEIEREKEASRDRPGLTEGDAVSVPLLRQFVQLLRKNFRTYWRSPSYNITRMLVIALMALMYGSIYWQQGAQISARTIQESRVQNLMGVLFSSVTFVAVFQLTAIQPIVAYERSVFTREQAAQMYSVWPKSIAQTLVELPFLLMQSIIFVPILYFMVGFVMSAHKFFFFWLVNLVSLSMFTFFGEWLVYVTPNQQLAQVFGAGINQVWNIMCGFLVAYPLMPVWWQWANRATPSTWLIYSLAASQMGDSNSLVLPVGTNASDIAAGAVKLSVYMEEDFGYSFDFRWYSLLIAFAFLLFFRITSTLALRYINFANR